MSSYLVIPARANSKRIPGKNLYPLGDGTILGQTIVAASSSNLFDSIVVSTDSAQIKKEAESAGAEVPFLRSKELSDDYSGTLPVVLDALERLDVKNDDLVVVMYSTSLLRRQTVEEFSVQLNEAPQDFHVGVRAFPHPLDRALKKAGEGNLVLRDLDHASSRTQDLEVYYFDTGKIYGSACSVWRSRKSMLDGPVRGFHVPLRESFDADTPEEIEFLTYLQKK